MMHPALTEILLDAALRALIIALVLWLGMRLLRISNALVQKAAWTVVLGAAVAMPFVIRWQPRPSWAVVSLPATAWPKWFGFEHRAQARATAPVAGVQKLPSVGDSSRAGEQLLPTANPYSEYDTPAVPVTEVPASRSVVSAAAKAAAAPVNWTARILNAAWLLYMGIGAALLLRLIYGLSLSAGLWMQARRIQGERRLDVPEGIEVRWSPSIGSPVNIGSGILLPQDYAEWDEKTLRVVLAHESAHIRQRDFYLQMLAGLYAAVVWFSPLGWWLKRKLSELSEAISDKAGLEAAGSPIAYAELLLEFAARPRPAFAGVAMAHSTNLHHRIERLLNESSFRRVSAGKRRSAIALLLPGVVIAATTLVHVQAAAIPSQSSTGQIANPPAAPARPEAARTGQSRPDQGADIEPAAATQTGAPTTSPAPAALPAPSPDAAPVPAPSPNPAPHVSVQINLPSLAPLLNLNQRLAILAPVPRNALLLNFDRLSRLAVIDPVQLVVPTPDEAAEDSHGDTYRVFGDEEHRWHQDRELSAECETAAGKTRQNMQGQVLFVCHDGKPYIIDDQAAMAQISEIDKEMSDKSEQMKSLSKQLRDESQQVREQARKERDAAERIPKPDITKEIAELDAAAAQLKADQNGNISREQLQELQRKLSEVQRRLVSVEVKIDVTSSVAMSKFSAEQGQFGEQMGKLGSQMGQLARERDQKIRSIIDESLKNGKAKPVN
jgi:beta-lactamase regulating signal transducer with metallopeptidase domain/predicted  nucleic acid-binding Zn-ribbon protein